MGRWALCLPLLLCAGRAFAAASWDGTWVGGWGDGEQIRIVVAGNKVTEVARGNAYAEVLSSEASPEGGMLCVWWIGGDSLLRRTGERAAIISLRERGRPMRSSGLRRE